ncbi:MAG: alpha/beta fold hydrolase [Anaerolinea sp.]
MNTLLNQPFFDEARQGRDHWTFYWITLGLAFVFMVVFTLILYVPVLLINPSAAVNLMDLPAPVLLTVTMLPFSGVILAIWLAVRFLHRRPFKSLIAPAGRFRWRLFLTSAFFWLVLCGFMDGVLALLQPGNYRWTFEPGAFFTFLPFAIVLTPIQIAAEELLFRGYLMQGIGVRARSVWLPLLIPAVFFTILHLSNPEVSEYGADWTVPMYFIMGILLGWVTLRSGGLELALGWHLANNWYAGIFVTFPSSAIPTPALFTIQQYDARVGLIGLIVISVIYLLVLEAVNRRMLGNLILAGMIFLSGCSGMPVRSPAVSTPTVPLQDCSLQSEVVPIIQQAKCADLRVPENPSNPGGRQISLHVAVVKARSTNPDPDPIFLLAGGPGQASTTAFVAMLTSLQRLNLKRDLVLVDQRGTGSSAPLSCPSDEQLPDLWNRGDVLDLDKAQEEMQTSLRECAQQWDADLRFYNTTVSAMDLEIVRQKLGYDRINLLGVSYGTRLAQEYARLYPQQVRTMILDGVLPPDWVLGETVRRDAQQSLERIFERCAQEEACRQAFPDLRGDFQKVMESLRRNPVEVVIPHPSTGKDQKVILNRITVASLIRMISYQSQFTILMPWMIHSAAQGDYRPMAAQAVYLLSQDQGVEEGFFYTVICQEDVPFIRAEGEQGEYYFQDVLPLWRTACQILDIPPQEAFRQPYPTLNIPVLLISGEADPVTPPANGEQAAKFFPQSLHVVFPKEGHGNFTSTCGLSLTRQVIEKGSIEAVDTACLERHAVMPFFLSQIELEP